MPWDPYYSYGFGYFNYKSFRASVTYASITFFVQDIVQQLIMHHMADDDLFCPAYIHLLISNAIRVDKHDRAVFTLAGTQD